jgi:hypothetical protein
MLLARADTRDTETARRHRDEATAYRELGMAGPLAIIETWLAAMEFSVLGPLEVHGDRR